MSNRSTHLALAINLKGKKELLGLWTADSEGAKYWLAVMTELKKRGVQDILIAAVDGLLCFMAIENISKKWRMPIKYWSQD